MPSDSNAKTRVQIGVFALLFVIGCSVGAYFIGDLGKLQDSLAARESQAALQGITDANQLDEALRQNPSNKLLQLMAMATKAADETSAATEKLTSEIEPSSISKAGNLAVLSRSDLEALRRDLNTAEANATAFLPRYVAVLKTERDKVENGEFIFAFQHTVNRYNAVAEAMTVAAKRVNDLEAERRDLQKSQQDSLAQLVSGR